MTIYFAQGLHFSVAHQLKTPLVVTHETWKRIYVHVRLSYTSNKGESD